MFLRPLTPFAKSTASTSPAAIVMKKLQLFVWMAVISASTDRDTLESTDRIQLTVLAVRANQNMTIFDLYHNPDQTWSTAATTDHSTTQTCLSLQGYYRSSLLDAWTVSGQLKVARVVLRLLDKDLLPLLTLEFDVSNSDGRDSSWFHKENLRQNPFEALLANYDCLFDAQGMRVQKRSKDHRGLFQVYSRHDQIQFLFVTTSKPSEMPLQERGGSVSAAEYLMMDLAIALEFVTSGSPTTPPAAPQPTETAVDRHTSATAPPAVHDVTTSEVTGEDLTSPSSTTQTATSGQDVTANSSEEIRTECVTFGPNGTMSSAVFTHQVLTPDQKHEVKATIYANLVIPRKTACIYRRKLVSALDPRSSSSLLGGVAILIITLTFGLIVLMDLTSWDRLCKRHNLTGT